MVRQDGKVVLLHYRGCSILSTHPPTPKYLQGPDTRRRWNVPDQAPPGSLGEGLYVRIPDDKTQMGGLTRARSDLPVLWL